MSTRMDDGSIDYDRVSQVYDSSRTAIAETCEKLIQLLQVSSTMMVLDMGCGTGNYTAAIAQVTENILGIDKSIGMLTKARLKYSQLNFIRCDVTNLPFKSGMFDAAFSIQVIHHVKDKLRFLKEAHRILRDGACFAIDLCSHQQMRTFWLYHYFPKGLELDLARIPDSYEIAGLLEKAGFCSVRTEISYTDIVREHEKPERYLDKNYRDGQSTFHLLSDNDVELGCKKLKEDINSGNVENIIRHYEVKERRVGGSSIIYGRKMAAI